MTEYDKLQSANLNLLLEAGVALSGEKDIDVLMELIITTSMKL